MFREFSQPVNSVDFTPDGKHACFASNDDSIAIYDCERGSKVKYLSCKKYGVSSLRFFHSGANSCVCASRSDFDHSLRYWDLYENAYVRYFKAHTAAVSFISVHPYEDIFMSGGFDRNIFLWDLRKEKPVARIPGRLRRR